MSEQNNKQLLISNLNDEGKINPESFTYQSVFLSSIVPDTTNARFLPAIAIDDEHAKLFIKRKLTKNQLVNIYNSEDHVMIGKSCIINCLKYGSVDWKKANQTIESIIELGNNISVSELIQAPTIYPIENSKFKILTGHRRFFALLYANGHGSAAQFKLYDEKPLLTKIKQFQENASREDLPQYGKLAAFSNAMLEIEQLNDAKIRVGMKKLSVKDTATKLGISMGAYDNYNVLTRYNAVVSAYELGLSYPFIKTKKLVLEIETTYKNTHQKLVLNISDKKAINEAIQSALSGDKQTITTKENFKVAPIKSTDTIKALLTTNIMSLDTGISWQDINWDDRIQVSKVMNNIIKYLENGSH